jgi:predicted phosphodiesterase
MRLYAIGDLHLANQANQDALVALPSYPDDWLALVGDVGETTEHLRLALSILTQRFAQVLWVPGNHDLWTMPADPVQLRGEARYQNLVTICRDHGVLTPEDRWVTWPGDGPTTILAPTFTLYDYSFRPDDVPEQQAVAWAAESGVICSDEFLLHADPYPSRAAWCRARCQATEARLAAVAGDARIVLINHYPLREDLFELRRIPRFSLWCGTRRTGDWSRRFPIAVAVYGHLHIRSTRYRDGVRFEEVSLGYPRDWDAELGLAPYLRQILPVPERSGQGYVLPPARYRHLVSRADLA